jgi:preprotein translocase subunit SecG
MLEAIVLVIHCATAGALIFLVLLHSGRGGGLSDMFGGGLGAAASGSTMVEKNLDRLTIVFGLTFAFTTLTLALMVDL